MNYTCRLSLGLEPGSNPRGSANDIVLAAYDVAAGLGQWRRVAATLAQMLAGPSLAILLFDDRTSAVEVLATAGTTDQGRIETYLTIIRRMANRPGAVSRRSASPRDNTDPTASTEMRWNSLSEPVTDHYLAGVSVNGVSDSRWLCVAVDIAGPAMVEEIHAAVDLVLPHFCRAAEMKRSLSAAAQRSFFSGAVFDRLPVGLVQLDRSEAVIYANAEADRLSRLREGLTISSGRARAASSADDAGLQAAIHQAADPRKGPFSRWLNVKRGESSRPYRVLVTTLSRSRAVEGDDSCCVLFIIDPERPSLIGSKAIAEAFGLTAAEAKVVAHLTMGMTLSEIAEKLKVSINTVRTLLARAMGKTTTNTQVALLRMVLTTLSLVGEITR